MDTGTRRCFLSRTRVNFDYRQMKILIVGAGIGGLSAALCLDQAGHEVLIFEQAKQFGELGAGLQVGANAMRVLDHLGLRPAVEAVSVAPLRAEFRGHRSGELLYSMQWGEDYSNRHGAPYLHVLRSDLHEILAQELMRRLPNGCELDTCVSSYSDNEQDITLQTRDGRFFTGDCLIGADGIRSIVKKQLLGAKNPVFTGNVAWRGVVPASRLPDDFMDRVATNFIGPQKHMVIYYLRNQQLVNFVGVVENKEWQDESWAAKAPWQELKADFSGWHPTVQAVIDAVDKDQCFRWALHQPAPLTNWSGKRVTLLGDAAHAMLPFMASGAAMAIEDARVLQRSFDQTQSVGEALQLYQGNRISRTTKVQRMSAQAGKLYHIKNPMLLKLAFSGINLMSRSRDAFLAEYDANTAPLA